MKRLQNRSLQFFHLSIRYRHLLACLLAEFRKGSRANSQCDVGLIARHQHRAAPQRFELQQLMVIKNESIQILGPEGAHPRPKRQIRG